MIRHVISGCGMSEPQSKPSSLGEALDGWIARNGMIKRFDLAAAVADVARRGRTADRCRHQGAVGDTRRNVVGSRHDACVGH